MTLLALRDATDPVCLGRDGVRRWSDLTEAARRLRPVLAGHDVVCNLAATRHDFATALLAAMAENVPTVLPTSRAEGAVAAAIEGYRKPLLVDRLQALAGAGGDGLPTEPEGEVHVFTSGSTGAPVRHVKDWTALAGGALIAARLVARAGLTPGRTIIVGTTPHQHMFGLEAVIFAALAHGHCFFDDIVFHPADLDAAVERAAVAGFDNVVLVTSPPHLRFLEDRIRAQPAVRCVISATAPLHRDLAARIEASGPPVFEIYGSTETGSLAWRRTSETDLWTPLDGFRLYRHDHGWEAGAPHLRGMMPLADELGLQPDGRFRLLGRRGDMVRVAGKRQSLGALNAALATAPGIADAVMLRESVDGEDRLRVFVVPAPDGETDADALARLVRQHMHRHVDPVFVPRRVTVVAELPRGATGKIAASDLAALDALPQPIVRRA